jgi:dihydroorotate dehydrogenase electron transfer subunit
MKDKLTESIIIDNIFLRNDVFLLLLSLPEEMPLPLPGQFVMLGAPGFFLRRPISVFGAEKSASGNTLSLLIRHKGDGTKKLSELSKGEKVSLSGAHGKECPLPENGKRVILCAGGIGLACVYFLGKHLVEKGFSPILIYGENKQGDILLKDELKKMFGDVILTCKDGSTGSLKVATDALCGILKDDDYLYTCGPSAMYETMQREKLFTENTFVFTEERMACGIGACAGSNLMTKDGY